MPIDWGIIVLLFFESLNYLLITLLIFYWLEKTQVAMNLFLLKYLQQINNDVANAEKELEKSIRNEDLLRLMKLQKTLVYFNTSIRGNEVSSGCTALTSRMTEVSLSGSMMMEVPVYPVCP